MRIEQQTQEDEYRFPYHFASSRGPAFRPGFVDTWALNYNLTIDLVLELLDQLQPHSVVDIGCGEGRLVAEISAQFPQVDVEGVDYSPRAIALGKVMHPELALIELDILESKPDKSYDVGILMEVAEHIEPNRLPDFIHAIAVLIRPAGHLIVTVPHENKPLEYKHFQHFNSHSVRKLFQARFDLLETRFIEKCGWLNIFLNALVVNRLWILNHARLLKWVYAIYGKQVFNSADERQCARLVMVFKRRSDA